MTTDDAQSDYITALEQFESAAFALLDAWRRYNSGEANGYPAYLPSFDEFANDIEQWRMAEIAAI
jgi:hypothetical protein